MIIIGIDPGVTGALALMEGGILEAVVDMPVNAGRVDGRGVADYLFAWDPDVVYLEWTQPMPKNGSIASYSLGLNSGIVIGVVQALGIPLERVRPSAWKLAMGLRGKPKAASRGLATEIWPDFASQFRRVKDDGRAEAALIARFGAYHQIHERTNDDKRQSADDDRPAGDRAVCTDSDRDRHPATPKARDQRTAARSGGRSPGVAQVRPLVRPVPAAPHPEG